MTYVDAWYFWRKELEIDLSGFKKEEVRAELKDGYLTVSAVKDLERMGRRGSPAAAVLHWSGKLGHQRGVQSEPAAKRGLAHGLRERAAGDYLQLQR